MSVIERWKDADLVSTGSDYLERPDGEQIMADKFIVEVVEEAVRLRDELRGAVAEVERLRRWIDATGRSGPDDDTVDAVLEQSAERFPTTGGQ